MAFYLGVLFVTVGYKEIVMSDYYLFTVNVFAGDPNASSLLESQRTFLLQISGPDELNETLNRLVRATSGASTVQVKHERVSVSSSHELVGYTTHKAYQSLA